VAKCPYCDFNSHTLRGELPAQRYIDTLIADFNQAVVAVAGRPVVAIFLGGGTPSLFPPDEMHRLLEAVRAGLTVQADAEITMEANPGAVEHAAFAGYRAAGINRLSLGVQSFADAKLKALGRIHSSADAVAAYQEARAAGFSNINLDLMYALPEQTVAQAQADLEQAIALNPDHISQYHLTLEPNTVFFSRPPPLPDSETAWEMQQRCAEILTAAGYHNYEVSAWARTDRHSRHNMNYWTFGDYLGLGAGAHGKLTHAPGVITREVRSAHPREYQSHLESGSQFAHSTAVSADDAVFEFMLNALRIRAGFELAGFERATGLPAERLLPGIQEAQRRDLLMEAAQGWYRATAHGWRFLDDLQGIFLPEPH
jgi:oxygen-independent coproporphyrinogen-3 oxidase